MKRVMIGTMAVPETIEQLHCVFVDLCGRLGLEVKNSGSSYSGGPYWNAEIRFPTSEDFALEAFTEIRESQDDEYVISRDEYEDAQEVEPVDPERPGTLHLTKEGAENLRRELEEAAYFAERMKADDADVGFAPGIQ